ncbi:MAG TPA: hypothetical protein VF663_11945 [Telluria sp.]
MSELRLGAVNLDPKDVAYVRALVRLFAHTEKLDWTYVDAAPYHAVVADARARAADPGFYERFAGVVLSLGDTPGASAADTLAYPIRANEFRDWLKLRQDSLADGRLAGAQPMPANTDTVMLAASSAASTVSALVYTSQAGRRYKLRRWPGAELLRGDPGAMRMATFMSRNALSVAQLAALTGQPEEACSRFVGVLQDAGLLVEIVAVPDQQERAPAASRAIALDLPHLPPAKQGLMASLRRHLGL